MTAPSSTPAAASTRVVKCVRCGKSNRVPAAAVGTPHCGNCHAPLPWIADAGDDTFATIAEAATVPVLVDLWAPWCAPCRGVSPVLERLASDLAGKFKLVKVNVDEAPSLSQRYEVRAVPTLLILKNGTVVAKQAGAPPADVLRRWVNDTINAPATPQ